jgi:hypothetical protein
LTGLKSGLFQTKAGTNQTRWQNEGESRRFARFCHLINSERERYQGCLLLMDGKMRGKACKTPAFAIVALFVWDQLNKR